MVGAELLASLTAAPVGSCLQYDRDVSAVETTIDERDNGRALADLVAAAIAERHPGVVIEQPETIPEYRGSMVFFTPPNPGGTPVLLYVNFDWSFQLEADGLILFEDAPMTGSPEDHFTWIVEEISTIARDGLHRRWHRIRANHKPWAV